MYDSVNPAGIPTTAEMVAGYVDGPNSVWPASAWARFPTAILRRISVWGPHNAGDVLDVERFDATPDQVVAWVQARRAAGVVMPWVYCDRSTRPLVERLMSAAGILSDQVALWIATLDGTQTVPAGPYPVAAVQYVDTGAYDLSIVSAEFSASGGTVESDMQPQTEDFIWRLEAAIIGVTAGTKAPNSGELLDPYNGLLEKAITAIVKANAVGGTEPPEPTTISGTFTGKLE